MNNITKIVVNDSSAQIIPNSVGNYIICEQQQQQEGTCPSSNSNLQYSSVSNIAESTTFTTNRPRILSRSFQSTSSSQLNTYSTSTFEHDNLIDTSSADNYDMLNPESDIYLNLPQDILSSNDVAQVELTSNSQFQNYVSTSSSIDNFSIANSQSQMNSTNNVFLTSENHSLFSVENNSSAVNNTYTIYPTNPPLSINENVNMMPIGQSSSINELSQQQPIQFSIGDLMNNSGGNVYELILQEGGSGPKFPDGSSMLVSSGDKFDNFSSDSTRQVLYSLNLSDNQLIPAPILEPSPTIINQPTIFNNNIVMNGGESQVQVQVDGSQNIFSNTQFASQNSTVIQVVNDFSDLIQTMPSGGENTNWQFVQIIPNDEREEEQQDEPELIDISEDVSDDDKNDEMEHEMNGNITTSIPYHTQTTIEVSVQNEKPSNPAWTNGEHTTPQINEDTENDANVSIPTPSELLPANKFFNERKRLVDSANYNAVAKPKIQPRPASEVPKNGSKRKALLVSNVKLPPIKIEPEEPPHIKHGLSKPVLQLEWSNGIASFPGKNLKFRVNEETGILETVGYSAQENLRHIPLKLSQPDENNSKNNMYTDSLSEDESEYSSSSEEDEVDEDEANVCLRCGKSETSSEFKNRKCRKCNEIEESSPSKFKFPKGITVLKSQTNSFNKSTCVPLNIDFSNTGSSDSLTPSEHSSTTESKGITVVPILQTPCTTKSIKVEKIETEKTSSSLKEKWKERRLLSDTNKKLKTSKTYLPQLRKRSLETVLNTRTQYLGKGECKKESVSEESIAPSLSTAKKGADFDWNKYLLENNAKGAPPRLFRQPAFPPTNPFKPGMMLEAIDPQHQSLFCVANIVEVQGYRMRLHLTGYSEMFDFWVNADSYDIFPPGWCEENNYDLEPPPTIEDFNWHKYLVDEELVPAERDYFSISKDTISSNSEIRKGMKLEAIDIRNLTLTCVASVQSVINDRVLIHFDSWECVYDYWTDTSSPFIHPVGWCKKNSVFLTPPKNYKGNFSWDNYLAETNSVAMPSHLFRPLPPISFKKGMKLEVVDKRNPYLIRVATIEETIGHQLIVHFDGWTSEYDYKVYECSPDIHPVGWCSATGHPLQPPPIRDGPWNGSCNVYGCLGLGHIKGYKFLTHNTEINCPYSSINYKKDWMELLPDRFLSYKRSLMLSQQETLGFCRRSESDKSRDKSELRKSSKILLSKRRSMENLHVGEFKKKKTEIEEEGEIKEEIDESNESISIKLQNLPNIESTITPVNSSSIFHWDEVIESVAKDASKKSELLENGTEFSLPPSTTMTPIPHPDSRKISDSLVINTQEESSAKSADRLLMIVSNKIGGDVTITPTTNNGGIKSENGIDISPFLLSPVLNSEGSESEYPPNYSLNIEHLRSYMVGVDEETVSKWKTKDVATFVKTLPGCTGTAKLFQKQKIDGEAFLMMTQSDFSEVLGLKTGPSVKLSHIVRLITNVEDPKIP